MVTRNRHPVPVRAGRLVAETFGEAGDPALLLINGAAAAMDWWDDDLCERLAAGPRLVIRYDPRDTGESSHDPAGAPTYTFTDLVDDAVAVLDTVGVRRAHLMGLSMGGGIAQVLGVVRPDRVATLTLVATSPAGPGADERPELPPITDRLRAFYADQPSEPKWHDLDAVVDHHVRVDQAHAGTLPYDEARVRRIARTSFGRTADVEASVRNHFALRDDEEPVVHRLDRIGAPTLVVHGSEDPLFPPAHADALVASIPGATLLTLPGMGHEVPPPPVWDVFVPAVLAHTR